MWESSQQHSDYTAPSSGRRTQHIVIRLYFLCSLVKNPAERADLKQLMVSVHVLRFARLILTSRTSVSSGASVHQTVGGRAGGFCRLVVQHHRPESAWDAHPWDSHVSSRNSVPSVVTGFVLSRWL